MHYILVLFLAAQWFWNIINLRLTLVIFMYCINLDVINKIHVNMHKTYSTEFHSIKEKLY